MTDMFRSRSIRHAGMALVAAIGILAPASVTSAAGETDLLFVQSAPDVAVSGDQLRLKNVSPLTLFFSDRPKRMTGVYKLDEWQKVWTDGSDSLKKDPPNAVLSVFEAGRADPTETVVELLDMKSEGADLVYSIKVLKGSLPAAGGESSLFIDDMPMSNFEQLEARDCYRHGCAGF